MTDNPRETGMKPIPIAAAQRVAQQYGYDQVVIIARKVGGEGVGGEHCTTYGVDRSNCAVAAKIGDFLKFKVMGWAKDPLHARSAARELAVNDAVDFVCEIAKDARIGIYWPMARAKRARAIAESLEVSRT